MRRFIYVQFRREGFHSYPAADRDPEIAFLANRHRHMFWIKAKIEVYHDDRELEFFKVLNDLHREYDYGTLSTNEQSCEMIAERLIAYLKETHGNRFYEVDVSEDGENGAIVNNLYPLNIQDIC